MLINDHFDHGCDHHCQIADGLTGYWWRHGTLTEIDLSNQFSSFLHPHNRIITYDTSRIISSLSIQIFQGPGLHWSWVTCVTLVLGPVTICCKIKSSTIRHKELLMMLHIENWIETHWSIKWKNAHIEVVQFLLVKSKEQLTHEGYHAKNLGNKKNLGNRNR